MAEHENRTRGVPFAAVFAIETVGCGAAALPACLDITDALIEPFVLRRLDIVLGREAADGARELLELTEADLTQMVHLIEGLDPAGMPSMAQDRIAQRKTEVEEFAGTVCRLAAKHDIQVPQNDWLYQRIREIESSW